MARSSWKIVSFQEQGQAQNLFKPTSTPSLSVNTNGKKYDDTKKIFYTQRRNCKLMKHHIGLEFAVYNGIKYQQLVVTQPMIGHRLGEFSFTRQRAEFKKTRGKGKK